MKNRAFLMGIIRSKLILYNKEINCIFQNKKMKKTSDDIIKFKTFIIYKRKKTLKYGIFTYNKISKLRSIKHKETFMPLFFIYQQSITLQ